MSKSYDTHKGIIAWFTRNTVAANLLFVFIAIVGALVVLMKLRVQLLPDFAIHNVNVGISYPGAAPQEVEEGIILKIEENIKTIEGINRIISTSREGYGSLNIEVSENYELSDIMDEVNIRINSIPTLPDSAEKPMVSQARFSRDVMWLSVYGDVSQRALKEIANDIQLELLAIPQITNVEVNGALPYELSIEISDQKLREYGLTLNQISTAVRNSSLDLPSGTIKTIGGDILVRTKEQAYNQYDFASIPLLNRADGTSLTIGDIATVKDGFVEYEGVSKFNGKSAIHIKVTSTSESDDVKTAEAVYKYLDAKKPTMPETVKIDGWGDTTYYLEGRLDLMKSNMYVGAILVFIMLSLFLRFKLAFWVMIGIPFCFLGAITLMYLYPAFSMTINMISLFGFILVLGIVVDDAIIIAESAWASSEEKGHSVDSVIEGTKRVATPATFGVLTTIAAFYPMLAIGGPMSPLWQSIALVVVFCLIFSLIESKLILPAHLAHMKIKEPSDYKNPKIRAVSQFFTNIRLGVGRGLKRFVNNTYEPMLRKAINARGLVIVGFVCMLLISTAGFIGAGWVKTVFFPNFPSDMLMVRIDMNEGSTAKQTIASLEYVDSKFDELNQQVIDETGLPIKKHSVSWNNNNTGANIFVELQKLENLPIDQFEINDRWRDLVGNLPGVKSISYGSAQGGPGGNGLGFRLVGSDIDQLLAAGDEFKAKLETFEGVYDVSDRLSDGKDEITIKLKPDAENLGLTIGNLSSQVRNAFFGSEAQRFQRDNEEIRVYVRYPLEERRSIGNLESMPVRTPAGDYVTFSDVATFEMSKGLSAITRIDGLRSNDINAKISGQGGVDMGAINREIYGVFLPQLMAKYPAIELRLGGASEDEDQLKYDLIIGFLVSMMLIFILMAIPLKSYSKPIIVMSAIPFGFIGAMVGHLVMGHDLSLLSIFGLIALSGVVVNDSLLMVDFINRARSEGMSRLEAAVMAGTRRFRAIVLTSLTTFIGLFPITFETSLQAQAVIPMAISLAFGIVFATVITLIWIPCLYIFLANVKDWFLERYNVRDSFTEQKQAELVAQSQTATENVSAVERH